MQLCKDRKSCNGVLIVCIELGMGRRGAGCQFNTKISCQKIITTNVEQGSHFHGYMIAA